MFEPIGISLTKFSNFFYNFQPDMVMCDLCELLLLCTSAGFNQIPYEFRDEINNTRITYFCKFTILRITQGRK